MAFDEPAQDLARTFAGYAAVALANTALHQSTVELTEQLQQALASRAVIDQAKGALMAVHGMSAEDAFALLSRTSQTSNRKLRDVANELLDNLTQGRPTNGHHHDGDGDGQRGGGRSGD